MVMARNNKTGKIIKISEKQVNKAFHRMMEELSKPDVAKHIEEVLKKVSKQNETKK